MRHLQEADALMHRIDQPIDQNCGHRRTVMPVRATPRESRVEQGSWRRKARRSRAEKSEAERERERIGLQIVDTATAMYYKLRVVMICRSPFREMRNRGCTSTTDETLCIAAGRAMRGFASWARPSAASGCPCLPPLSFPRQFRNLNSAGRTTVDSYRILYSSNLHSWQPHQDKPHSTSRQRPPFATPGLSASPRLWLNDAHLNRDHPKQRLAWLITAITMDRAEAAEAGG